MSGRPLDVLEASLGEEVLVHLKDGQVFRGTLTGYDQHMNLVLESPTTVGDAGGGAGDGDAAGAGGPAGAGDGEDGDGTAGADPDGGTLRPEERGKLTIVRGDNLVSVTA